MYWRSWCVNGQVTRNRNRQGTSWSSRPAASGGTKRDHVGRQQVHVRMASCWRSGQSGPFNNKIPLIAWKSWPPSFVNLWHGQQGLAAVCSFPRGDKWVRTFPVNCIDRSFFLILYTCKGWNPNSWRPQSVFVFAKTLLRPHSLLLSLYASCFHRHVCWVYIFISTVH
jgi:hypothetical protein